MSDGDGEIRPQADFDHDLCHCCSRCCGNGCCSDGECCIAFWCSTCQTNRIHSHLIGDRPSQCFKPCNAPTIIFSIGVGLSVVVGAIVTAVAPQATIAFNAGGLVLQGHHCYVRQRLVHEMHIDESCCQTCLKSFFCTPCSSVQMTDTLHNQRVKARFILD